MSYFSCNQKANHQHKHLKGNYVFSWQCSEAPVPLHCLSRGRFFFHMPAWLKAIRRKMRILTWHTVNGWPRTWFMFLLRFWHVKRSAPSFLPKTVVDTQLLFLLFFFPQSYPAVVGKLFLRLSLQGRITRKKEHFSHFLASTISLSTHRPISSASFTQIRY